MRMQTCRRALASRTFLRVLLVSAMMIGLGPSSWALNIDLLGTVSQNL